jgi:hypothetical protein
MHPMTILARAYRADGFETKVEKPEPPAAPAAASAVNETSGHDDKHEKDENR